MLNPAIGELIENYENRYELVLDVADCAREISKQAEEDGEIILEKTVSLAINKLASEIK
ncbi:MAG: DNA-directed RNA polymerase subunit omega [Clostridia bacterium]|nr:DNA-directed RNA polymerase subunit omega [Clostridia bacterium]